MDNANTESYAEREKQWDQQWPSSDAESRNRQATGGLADDDDLEGLFSGVSGTTDSMEAVQDAEPYMPPVDPPVLPGGREGIHMATGFGNSTEEEAAAGITLQGDEAIHDRVMRVLHHDSLASRYRWSVNVVDGVVRLRGAVSSLDDADNAMSVIGEIPGVVDVVDMTTLDTSLG